MATTKDLPFLPHILPNLLEVAISHILILCFVLKDHLWIYWKWLGVNDYWWSTSWVNETRVQKIQISRFFQSQSGSKLLITNPKLNIWSDALTKLTTPIKKLKLWPNEVLSERRLPMVHDSWLVLLLENRKSAITPL